MGLLLALSVFVYPVVLPFATLGLLFFVASSQELGLRPLCTRAALVLTALVATLAPGVVSTTSGSFLLPWWLHMAIGHSDVHYYVGEYALACTALLAVMAMAFTAWRAVSASRRGKAKGAAGGRRGH